MEMELPKQLPLTYMEVAELDCLHDEGVAYARRLEEAGGTVELPQPFGRAAAWPVGRMNPFGIFRPKQTENAVFCALGNRRVHLSDFRLCGIISDGSHEKR